MITAPWVAIFLLITVVTSFTVHYYLRYIIPGFFIAGILSSFIYELVGFVIQGHLDPFFVFESVFVALFAMPIAAIIGWIMQKYRDGKETGNENAVN